MKRLLLCLLAVTCLATGLALAQGDDPFKDKLAKSPRHHEWVKVKAKKDRQVSTFVVMPEVNKPATAVVVIHENKGLTSWVRLVADRLAEAGYVALAPDLLSGMGPDGGNSDAFKSVDDATKALYKLSESQVMDDLDAVVEYARGLKNCNKKVAVGGFCWGGGQTFAYATHNPDIAAAFVFYGKAPKGDAMKKIKAPVYGFYGKMDNNITGELPEVTREMTAAGKTFEPVVYDGAGHGFMRAGEMPNASKANSEAQKKGWERWEKILKGL